MALEGKLPSAILLKRLRDKKIEKYMWIPEVLSRMLISRLPTNTTLEFDDLYQAGIEELIIQMNRLYTDENMIRRLWNKDKKDLTVGPFFLKGLKSPYISKSDSGSVKFIKGAILDLMREKDPAPPRERQELKKISKYRREYANAMNGIQPRRRQIKEYFGYTDEQLDKILQYE